MKRTLFFLTIGIIFSTKILSQCGTGIIVNMTNPTQAVTNCEGAEITFDLFPFDTANVYTWAYPAGAPSNALGFGEKDAYGIIYNADMTHSGTYKVTVTTPQGCVHTDSVMVLIRPVPKVMFSGMSYACLHDSTSLVALDIAGAYGPYQYYWENGASTKKIYLLHEGGFSPAPQITMTNKYGCRGYNQSPFFIGTWFPDDATITATRDTTFCAGKNTVLHIATPAIGQYYQWYRDSTKFSVLYDSAVTAKSGMHYLKLKNIYGCKSISQQIQVTSVPRPLVSITASDTAICNGVPVVFTASSNQAVSWSWLKNNIPIQNAIDTFYAATTPGLYKAMATNSTNCTAQTPVIKIRSYTCREQETEIATDVVINYNSILHQLEVEGILDDDAMIYNAAGSLVKKVGKGSQNINLQSLTTGIYVLVYYQYGKANTYKWVLQ